MAKTPPSDAARDKSIDTRVLASANRRLDELVRIVRTPEGREKLKAALVAAADRL